MSQEDKKQLPHRMMTQEEMERLLPEAVVLKAPKSALAGHTSGQEPKDEELAQVKRTSNPSSHVRS